MGIEFNPVSEVKETGLVGRIGQTIQKSLGQIFTAKTQDFGQGVTVESSRFAELEEHFKDVPELTLPTGTVPQLNLDGIDFVDLMGVAGIDY